MKKHIVIPIIYRQYRDEKTGWFAAEMDVDAHNTSKNSDFLKGLEGSEALEVLLDNGWQIKTVQATSQDGSDSVAGAAVFQYILESPEIN